MIFLFSLFKITSVYLKCSVTHIRILKGAVLGAVVMCLLLVLPLPNCLKFVLGYGILNLFLIRYIFRGKFFCGKNPLFIKGKEDLKRTLQIAVTVMVVAMLLGGGLFVSGKIKKPETTMQISLITLAEGMVICIALRWSQKEKKQKIYSVRLIQGEHILCTDGLLDTGNSLVEPISKKPVSVVELSVVQGDFLPETGYRIIPFRSVGMENGLMDGYILERMEIDGPYGMICIERPVIAISKQPLSTNGTYRMILHPKLFVESEE